MSTTEEVLGLKIEFFGFASIVENIASDMKQVPVNSSNRELRISERLLISEEASIDATISPTGPSSDMSGQFVALPS